MRRETAQDRADNTTAAIDGMADLLNEFERIWQAAHRDGYGPTGTRCMKEKWVMLRTAHLRALYLARAASCEEESLARVG